MSIRIQDDDRPRRIVIEHGDALPPGYRLEWTLTCNPPKYVCVKEFAQDGNVMRPVQPADAISEDEIQAELRDLAVKRILDRRNGRDRKPPPYKDADGPDIRPLPYHGDGINIHPLPYHGDGAYVPAPYRKPLPYRGKDGGIKPRRRGGYGGIVPTAISSIQHS